ncbi:glycoside hydrolase family 108 protein [Chromobacterium subtsugae]|uniref:glycoside hydrolase family 108 protein n=1 Tax=Chromobacterium subtsugae TaxID=251747 RepID=UPI0006415274|nr:glycosyl hydrolase 108 family protein [Chromobacterium subtsugae]OBU84587.1 hypothetical protein MY55_21415 [Chromobacterium subtsugae]
MANFNAAFTALIGNEGGYSNNPHDPGGETMWGVTKRVAVAAGYTGAMRDMPLATAQAIAKREYWDKFQCDALPDALAFQVLDAAYNGGFPAKWLQNAVGVHPDGHIGQATIQAANAMDPARSVLRFLAYRLAYMTTLRTWPTFGKGWAARISRNMLKGAV